MPPYAENGYGSQLSKKFLHSFAGEHDQGRVVLDIIVRVCMITLTSYHGETELQYFALISQTLEVCTEKVTQLNREAFVHIIGALDFGIQHQDVDVVDMCLRAVNTLASYHYKERIAGRGGLGANAIDSQESIVSHFSGMLVQLFLFEDFRMELAGSAADTLLPLLLCEQELYQRLVQEFLERQAHPAVRTRLAGALHSLTSANQLSSSLDRPNRQRFRKNFHQFLIEISSLRLK